MAGRHFWLAFAGIAALAVLVYLYLAQGLIAAWGFPDPDDQMRLQEVRDFLGGQAWSDVSQHRMNAPWGAAMHWSRLIDLPIAGVIVALGPWLGAGEAERIAVIAVPLMTLVASMGLTALLARRLAGPAAGLAAAALLPLTTGAMQQMRPLRIDHHGWQVTIALAMAFVLVGRRRHAGAAAGALAALWLSISLEGLPFCAATGALLALRWLGDSEAERERFTGFTGALALASTALFALTKPAGDWAIPACDAVSPLHLIVFGAAAIGTLAATRVRGMALQIAALGAVGIVCAGLYAGIAPVCTRGAFAQLDPLTLKYWYGNVREGLPIWRLSIAVGAAAVSFPLVAMIGAWLGWRGREGAERARWLDYVALLIAATLVAVCVQRAGAVANALALPAGIALMAAALAWTQRLRATLPRVLASAGVLVLLLPAAPALTASALTERNADQAKPATTRSECATTANFATAARLAPGIAFTNIDIGPGILFTTRHQVVASGHHRNRAGIHDVLAAFLGSERQAHRLIARRGTAYLIVCADMVEMDVYAHAAPKGFWAQLAGGRTPGWLRPVRIPGSQLSVWRVVG